MSIDSKIEKVYKDMSGSTAKNRLTIQISFAVKLIVDIYSIEDFTIFLDCIEDVAVKTISAGNEKITLYQIKSKKNSTFTLNYMIAEEWLQKLYKHTQEFAGLDYEIALVSNTEITDGGTVLFPNEKSSISSDIIDEDNARLTKIKKCISKNENIDLEKVDLSNFYVIKTNLHTDTHKDQARQIFSDFIANIDPNAEYSKIKAFFIALYDTLDAKFNCEINPKNTDFNEITQKKGYTKNEFEQALQAFLNSSIPKNSELFSLLNITSISEQREIVAGRGSFLMDLVKMDEPFKILLSELLGFINNANTSTLIKSCVDYVFTNEKISPIYKTPSYIKFATAYMYYQFINGGIISE